MTIPLTATTIFIETFAMLMCWFVVGARMNKLGEGAVSRQNILLRRFLGYMGIFFFFMFVPNIWLVFDSSNFPLMMAIGYTVGHIFMFLACVELIRLFFSMIPQISAKENIAAIIGYIVTVIGTLVTAYTMIFGTRPEYDHGNSVVLFNAATVVGVTIAATVFITVLPNAILFIINGFRNPGPRLRSLLLGVGLLLMIIGGPMHDNATTGKAYAIADIITLISLLVITSGVLYRIQGTANTKNSR